MDIIVFSKAVILDFFLSFSLNGVHVKQASSDINLYLLYSLLFC